MDVEDLDVQVEVFDDCVMVVFPRPLSELHIPYQQAYVLGEVLEHAAGFIESKGTVGSVHPEIESLSLKLRTHREDVVLVCYHTDRIKLTYESARVVARSIKMKAQDIDFLVNKKVRIIIKDGHLLPLWDHSQRVFKTS